MLVQFYPTRPPLDFADFIDAPCGPPPFAGDELLTSSQALNQSITSKINDLDDEGGFFTVQGAYDYQFAPRWVVGAFVDADWSDLSAHARQSQTLSTTGSFPQVPAPPQSFAINTNTTIDTLVSADWSISVGGRIGWLANPRTLLYFLAAYTHVELDDAWLRVSITDPLTGLDLNPLNIAGFLQSFPNSPTSFLITLPDSLDGFSLGGGGEVKLGGPWAIKMEYRWTHLDGGSGRTSNRDSQSFASSFPISGTCTLTSCAALLNFRDINSQASADYDLDLHTVRAVLTYHFWSGRGYGG